MPTVACAIGTAGAEAIAWICEEGRHAVCYAHGCGAEADTLPNLVHAMWCPLEGNHVKVTSIVEQDKLEARWKAR